MHDWAHSGKLHYIDGPALECDIACIPSFIRKDDKQSTSYMMLNIHMKNIKSKYQR